jgi:pyruvate carboxylase
MSGLTSQPNLGSIAAALQGASATPASTWTPAGAVRYWEGVRRFYAPFEADIRSGTADVYRHEMPGGQYTNLREQARAMGLEHRWAEVSKAYADVNRLFGDIVKVTPTSKVVGDMALFMVANDLTPAEVRDPEREVAFPESVVSLMKGELGYPPDGFPPTLQKKVLKGEKPLPGRAGDFLPAVDLEAKRAEAEAATGRQVSDTDLASYLMYPKVFKDYAAHRSHYGDVSVLPTPAFFYGLREREEIAVEIERGKTLIVSQQGMSGPDEEGHVKVLRTERPAAHGAHRQGRHGGAEASQAPAEEGNPPARRRADARHGGHRRRAVRAEGGKGDPLVSIEAMKMESMLTAERDGVVAAIHVKPGEAVNAKDLLHEAALARRIPRTG